MSVARGKATDFSCVTTKNMTMKGANFLEKLLDNQPVEWKKLGEVCELITDFTAAGSFASNAKNVKYLNNPDYALLVRTTDLKQKFQNKDRFIYVDEKAFEYLWRVKLDVESIIMPNVGNCGEVYFVSPKQLPYSRCVLGPNALLIRSYIANQKFLFYLFHSTDFQAKLSKITSSTGQTKFNKTNLKQLSIPLPPHSVQSRIVEILDKFTALEAELEEQLQAELELRKKQYAYYCEQLLNFSYTPPSEFNIVCKKLGEVAELVRGNGLSKKDFAPEGIPAIHYGQIYTYYGNETKGTISFVTPETASKLRKVFCGNVVITNTSENLEDVGKALLYSGESEAVTGGHATIIRCSEHLLPKYFVYYTMTYSFFDQKRKLAKGTKVIDVSATDLARIEIPLPPLSEQQRIVEILDKFDTLTNSISEGLPLEIQLRRQQYEYYREQLLAFPHP